jgi:hypothetical protein
MPLSRPNTIPGFTVSPIMPEYFTSGDIWIERGVNEVKGQWVFNGSLWLSTENYIGALHSISSSSSSSGTRYKSQCKSGNDNVWIERLLSSLYYVGTQDSDNYWRYSVVGISENNTSIVIAADKTTNYSGFGSSPGRYVNTAIEINTLLDFRSGSSYPNIRIDITKVGSPVGVLLYHGSLVCRLARPS